MINGYFPQGESRDHPVNFRTKAFYAELSQMLAQGYTGTGPAADRRHERRADR